MATEQLELAITQDSIRGISIAETPALRFSERVLLLALTDTVIVMASFLAALLIRLRLNAEFNLYFAAQSAGEIGSWFSLFGALWLATAFPLGCYNLARAASLRLSFRRTSLALLVTYLIYFTIPYVTPTLPTKRVQLALFPLLGIAGISVWRAFYVTLFTRLKAFKQNVLIIGANEVGARLVQALDRSDLESGKLLPQHDYSIVGFVDDNHSGLRTTIAGVPILGAGRDLVRLADQHQVDEIILAEPNPSELDSETFDAMLKCRERGISITTVSRLYEQLTGRVPIEYAGRDLSVALPLGQSATYRVYLLLQRALDVLGSLVGLFVMALVTPLIWAVNRRQSPGPLFYSQTRTGKGGRPFTIYKFRSMIVDAEKFTGAVWATEEDPRITRFGKFLRVTRLDELPQFWNVLKGEMSLVGPRPERPVFVAQLAAQIPYYRVRHAVKPGLTGWTQVMCRYGSSVEDQFLRLQCDLYYIKNQSLLLDLEILLRTVSVMLTKKGR